MFISPGAPSYEAAVDDLQEAVNELKIDKPTNTNDIRAILNRLISQALRLRVNIEYEMSVRNNYD